MSDLLPELEAIDSMPAAALPAVLARAAAVQTRVAARLVALGPAAPAIEDRLLTIEEASRELGKSTTWLYHQAKHLPFTRRVGRSLRFSSRGLQKFLDRQRG